MRRALLVAAAAGAVAAAAVALAPSLARTLALAAQQQPSRDSVARRLPYVFRDTVTVRRLTVGNEAEVQRVVSELLEREAHLVRQLTLLPLTEVQSREALSTELQRVAREAFTMMSVIESRCMGERVSVPTGYLGINFDTEVQVQDRRVTLERSVVTSVEPGSPAQRAGIQSGDYLIAIAGREFRTRIPDLSDVLEPGRRVAVRYERAGTPQEVTLTVTPRPESFVSSCPRFERAMQPLRAGVVGRVWMTDSTDSRGNRFAFVVTPKPPAPLPSRVTAQTPPTPAVAPAPPTPPVPSQVMVFGSGAAFGGRISYFGGAQFRVLDDDWRNVLGLRANVVGVLVNEVAPGSAAAQAGLKVGDVVTTVNGSQATSPFVVSRLLGVSEDLRATLQIVRARERRTVTMSWGAR
ncbi:MAG: PDZ domain-containing protein [Gemmatimonadaceae bacterium]